VLKRVLSIWMLLVCALPALAVGSLAPCEHQRPCCQQQRAPANSLQAVRCCQLERAARAPSPVAVQQAHPERVVAFAIALPAAVGAEPWRGRGERRVTADSPPVRPKRFLLLRQLLI
jgi:hypothetical protein